MASVTKIDGSLIQGANLSDIDRLLEIEKSTIAPSWNRSLLLERLKNNEVLVFKVKGDIYAFLVAQEVVDEATLLQITVHAEYQSQGYGKQLLRCWLNGLSEGIRTVWLEVRESNLIAQNLYISCGFEKVNIRKKYYRSSISNQREDAFIFCFETSNGMNIS